MTDFRRFQELAKIAVTCLEKNTIDYVVVGGAVVGVYGAIRSTEDIDIMLKLEANDESKIASLVTCFLKNKLSITKDELALGLNEHSPITVFDLKNPILRLDLKQIWTKLDYSTFNLRRKVDLFGVGKSFWISAPESLVVVKLLPGFQSEKDLADVHGILIRSHNLINWSLLDTLAEEFNVRNSLEKMKIELKLK